jgi:hypothetical protein
MSSGVIRSREKVTADLKTAVPDPSIARGDLARDGKQALLF